MHEIYIVDRDRTEAGSVDGKLTYAASDATRTFFIGSIHPLGTVEAVACLDCGRVLLYTNRGGKP